MFDEPLFAFSASQPMTLEELQQVVTALGRPGMTIEVDVTLVVPDTVEDDLAAVTVPDPRSTEEVLGEGFRRMVRAVSADLPPAPVNEWLVGTTIVANEQAIALGRHPADPMTPDAALAYAAWIVALADPLGERFPKVLASVLFS